MQEPTLGELALGVFLGWSLGWVVGKAYNWWMQLEWGSKDKSQRDVKKKGD